MTDDAVAPTPPAPTEPPLPAKRSWLREPMWVLGLVVLVDEADKNIVRGLVTPLQNDLGINDVQIAILLSAALLLNGLVTIPAGYLADRWIRTRAIGKTVVGWSFLSALGALSLGFPMLLVMRSALGVGQAISEPSAAALTGDYYPPDQRGKAFSIQQMMLFIGVGLGVAMGGAIGNTLGWRPALVIVAIPGLLVAALVFKLKEPRRGSADMMAAIGAAAPVEDGEDHESQPLFEGGFKQFLADMVDGLKADMRTILSIRTMKYALVGVAAILFSITAVAAWLPQFYERQLGVKPGFGEGWVGLVALSGVPGVLLGGRAADKWAQKLEGGRLALPAIFLFIGMTILTAGYLIRPTTPDTVVAAQAAAVQAADAADAHVEELEAAGAPQAQIDEAKDEAKDLDEAADEEGRKPLGYSSVVFLVVFAFQFAGFGTMCMAIPGLRAGLTDAVPAHLRGTGFGAFNLVSVVGGQAAAPFVVGALSSTFDENLRTAFLLVSPISFVGAAVLYRARKFLDEDMNKIMMAVLQALQHEQEKAAEKAAEQGGSPA